MTRIVRSKRAHADLLDIWLYTGEDDPARADKLMDTIEEKCQMIVRHPRMGRARPELARSLRSFPAGDYVIFYRPIKDGIVIVRVLHASRDIHSLF